MESENPEKDNIGAGRPPVLHPSRPFEQAGGPRIEIIAGAAAFTARVSQPLGMEQAEEVPDSRRLEEVSDINYAFESDMLDSMMISWGDEQTCPTLEMIPGIPRREEEPDPEEQQGKNSRETRSIKTISSGPAGEAGMAGFLEPIDTEKLTGLDVLLKNSPRPAEPDLTFGAPGPVRVRDDGVEDPVNGWRPTGLVFFETLSTPPRGIRYSMSLIPPSFPIPAEPVVSPEPGEAKLGAEIPVRAPEASQDSPVHLADETPTMEPEVPFFDFPDQVPPAPPEDTDVGEPVLSGGGGRPPGVFHRLLHWFGWTLIGLFAAAGITMIVAVLLYAWYAKNRMYEPQSDHAVVTLLIQPGEGFRSVLNTMHDKQLLGSYMGLDDRYLMRFLAYSLENSNKIKPGVYQFSKSLSLKDVYEKLIEGSKDFKVTIPEGKTALEVAEILKKKYDSFDTKHFMELVNSPAFAKKLGIDAPGLEGYLYPSTYFFGPGMREEDLVELMVGTFKKKVSETLGTMTTSDGITFYGHVIIASLIEREARMDSDRPLIASVIYNRLSKGIPLQIDATVNYALKSWRRLTYADYKIDSPYNTYTHKGLPPGPIASPRIESLLATFNAPDTKYLYYVYKGDGHHVFAETYEQHMANVGRYIKERNAVTMGNEPLNQFDQTHSSDNQESSVVSDGKKEPSVAKSENSKAGGENKESAGSEKKQESSKKAKSSEESKSSGKDVKEKSGSEKGKS